MAFSVKFIRSQLRFLKPLMENLSSKGLYLLLNAKSVEEGEAMLKEISRLTHE